MANLKDVEKIIGIPRAMSFYNNYPFYYGFFNDLGIKIVLSDVTTKQTMSEGAGLVVTETCLPIKVYVGHVLNLIKKGVTNIFVPSLQSIDNKIYNCSKIRGLPDLIKNVIKEPCNIIDATLDKSEKNRGLYEFLAEAVKPFGITDKKLIKKASKAGWRCYNNFHIMSKSGMPYSKALSYALQGKVAGLTISSGAGSMGGSSKILIRGNNSLSGNNQPLFVVDGVPIEGKDYNSTSTARGGGGIDGR